MADYLAQWLSESPALAKRIKEDPSLERYLRITQPSGIKKGVSDNEWKLIVDRLKQ